MEWTLLGYIAPHVGARAGMVLGYLAPLALGMIGSLALADAAHPPAPVALHGADYGVYAFPRRAVPEWQLFPILLVPACA